MTSQLEAMSVATAPTVARRTTPKSGKAKSKPAAMTKEEMLQTLSMEVQCHADFTHCPQCHDPLGDKPVLLDCFHGLCAPCHAKNKAVKAKAAKQGAATAVCAKCRLRGRVDGLTTDWISHRHSKTSQLHGCVLCSG